jgi:thiosulfate dehydrogenase [quinone] large subunit
MNLNYLLAGAVSINPILAALGLLLVLGWRTAGFLGFDGLVLPRVGTPWTRSRHQKTTTTPAKKDTDRDNILAR